MICALLALVCFRVSSQDMNLRLRNFDSSYPGVEELDSRVLSFMREWRLKGLSLSVARNDSLVFSKGYGWADEEASESMRPGSIMRVASVSKLITAIGIMVLVDRGELSLRDRLFTEDGLLSEFSDCIRDTTAYAITVENLLRHEAGFDERRFDPMFSTEQVMKHYGLKKIPGAGDILRCILSERLAFYPGTDKRYSNLGYAVLSLVIEKVTGRSYESWIQENVLEPAGCFDMHIGGNYLSQRLPGEVRYYPSETNATAREYNGSGRTVNRSYGGSNITALQGAGGWVASAPELARLVSSVNGCPILKDIISAESVADMTRYYDESTYPLGWISVNPDEGWTRTGTLAGTTALIRVFPDGECWIVLTNTGTWKGPAFSRHTKEFVGECREMVYYSLPAQNLF